MTPAEHYAEAERLLEMYREGSTETNREWATEWGPQVLSAAQAHASLARLPRPADLEYIVGLVTELRDNAEVRFNVDTGENWMLRIDLFHPWEGHPEVAYLRVDHLETLLRAVQ